MEKHRRLGESLSSSRNSLNFVRLLLATAVIVSHVLDPTLFSADLFNNWTLGGLAVWGFFAISGYLITKSALSQGFFRYLWKRVIRIYPGFVLSLVFTAFVFGPIVWMLTSHPGGHQGLNEYFSAPRIETPVISGSPWAYVIANLGLNIRVVWVAEVMRNSSLWTLWFEALCYLVVGALAVLGILRRRLFVLASTAVLAAFIVVTLLTPRLFSEFNAYHGANFQWMNLAKLLLMFMVGSNLYLFRDHVPDSGVLALALTGAVIISLWLPTADMFHNPHYYFTWTDLSVVMLAYPVLWLGAHLPSPRFTQRDDYSYGLYVFSFPVQVVIVTLFPSDTPAYLLIPIVIAATAPLAFASWWLVERNFLKLKDWEPPALGRFRTNRL